MDLPLVPHGASGHMGLCDPVIDAPYATWHLGPCDLPKRPALGLLYQHRSQGTLGSQVHHPATYGQQALESGVLGLPALAWQANRPVLHGLYTRVSTCRYILGAIHPHPPSPDWGRYAPDFAEAAYILCVARRGTHKGLPLRRLPWEIPTPVSPPSPTAGHRGTGLPRVR